MTDSPPNMNPATVSSVSIPISGRRMTISRARMPASAAGLAPAATGGGLRLGLELGARVHAAARLAGQARRQREQDDRR